MLPFFRQEMCCSVRCGRLVLFIVRKWSDKAILITAILFSLQPIEWFHYIMSLCNPAYTLPDLNVGAMYAEVADYTKAGNFWDFLIGNITLGQKASLFWAIGAGRFCKLPDYSCLACISDAKELFVATESHLRFWKSAHYHSYQLCATIFFKKSRSCKVTAA